MQFKINLTEKFIQEQKAEASGASPFLLAGEAGSRHFD